MGVEVIGQPVKKYLTWQDVEQLVDRLLQQIRIDEFDALLVITRGGMVPACLISEKTGMRNILVAAVMFYTGVGETLDRPTFLQFPPDPYLKGKRVLVVDDVWDSGRTVASVKHRVEEAGGRPAVAVMHYKPQRSVVPGKPDFYAEETDDWIVYPWDPEAER
ncbi:phosphoribosyltransferase [Thermaerobacter marianensis]|uniref:phosphoribosyltransferase n=1 Tax=Thermaerobacter marianensis TaxID=73919 RepID=UPI0002F64BF9|nr:phosphoribosyltransferase family protein [Thermaerobacter marianensis]